MRSSSNKGLGNDSKKVTQESPAKKKDNSQFIAPTQTTMTPVPKENELQDYTETQALVPKTEEKQPQDSHIPEHIPMIQRLRRHPFPPLRAPPKRRRGTCYEWWNRSWTERSVLFQLFFMVTALYFSYSLVYLLFIHFISEYYSVLMSDTIGQVIEREAITKIQNSMKHMKINFEEFI